MSPGFQKNHVLHLFFWCKNPPAGTAFNALIETFNLGQETRVGTCWEKDLRIGFFANHPGFFPTFSKRFTQPPWWLPSLIFCGRQTKASERPTMSVSRSTDNSMNMSHSMRDSILAAFMAWVQRLFRVGDGELQNSWRYFVRPLRIKILHLKFWPLGFDVL